MSSISRTNGLNHGWRRRFRWSWQMSTLFALLFSVLLLSYFTSKLLSGKTLLLNAELYVFQTQSSGNETLEEKGCYDGFLDKEDLSMRFQEKCSWWVKLVEDWKQKVRLAGENAELLVATQERSGAGDRLMGAMTIFYHALHRGSKLHMSWNRIDHIFQPSCSLKDGTEEYFELSGLREEHDEESCSKHETYYKCGVADHIRDDCQTYNRACMQTKHCEELNDIYRGNLSMAHVIGCPLRYIFGPTQELLRSEVKYFIDGSIRTSTFQELILELRKYHVIATHARMGDSAMTASIKENKAHNQIVLEDIDRCNEWITAHYKKNTNTKPVKWLITSDDQSIRNHFKQVYPNMTITLELIVHHIKRVNYKRTSAEEKLNTLKSLFAEWFLIGIADELLSNSIHRFGVSSFSRSAWLYNLKSQYYEARVDEHIVCYKREYGFQGNTGTVSKECRRLNPLLGKTYPPGVGLPQLHWPHSYAESQRNT